MKSARLKVVRTGRRVHSGWPELRDPLELPWRQIAGLRDVLIHDYPNVDLERIWLVASRDVPELRVIESYLHGRGEI